MFSHASAQQPSGLRAYAQCFDRVSLSESAFCCVVHMVSMALEPDRNHGLSRTLPFHFRLLYHIVMQPFREYLPTIYCRLISTGMATETCYV